MKKVRCIGLDVHADTVAVAVAEPHGEVRSMGVTPNRAESIRKLGRGKCQQHVVTAVGRELLGFIWAIGVTVARQQRETSTSVAA